MNTDLSSQMLAMNTAKLHSSVQIAVFKKAHDMQAELLDALVRPVRAAAPPGQGARVDKLA